MVQINEKFAYLIGVPAAIVFAYLLVNVAPAYALAGAIGLGILFATFQNTDFAIYILIFSMLLSPEFGSRTTTGGGVTIRMDDLILAVIAFSWLVKLGLYQDLGVFKKSALNKPIGLYLFACVASTGFGMIRGDVNYASGFFFLFKYAEYFIVYFMVMNHIKTRDQLNKYFTAIIITYVFVVIISLLQIPQGERLTAPFEGKGGEPNTLGGYLVFIIAINLSIILTSDVIKKQWMKRTLLVITMVSVIPMLMTNSRGSWVAGIPVVIAYLFVHESRYIVLGFVVLLLIFSPFILPESVTDRVKYTFTEQKGYARGLQEEVGGIMLDTSASERIRSWTNAFIEFPKHPLLGFGVTGWRFLDAQYMRTLIETGVIGLVLFFYLLLSILKHSWNIYQTIKTRFFKSLALGFFVATIAMMTHGIGANTFIIVRIMEPFWLVCALVMSLPEIEKYEENKEKLEQKIEAPHIRVI